MMSYCGFNCQKCPLYIATTINDKSLSQSVNEAYNLSSDSTCLGCKSDKSCKLCSNCQIRNCATAKSLDNCGKCSLYNECKKIEIVINTNIESKEYLDSQKKSM